MRTMPWNVEILGYGLGHIYLDYVNNYLTPSSMADSYGIDTELMIRIIEVSRDLYCTIHPPI